MNQRSGKKKMRNQLFFGGISGLLVLCLFFLWQGREAHSAQRAHFSAAASLKDVLEEITAQFHLDHPQIEITLDFGGSGAIRQKVLAGAPIDGVFLASEKEITDLVEAGSVEKIQPILTNQLVVIQPTNANVSDGDLINQLRSAEVIAIGEGQSVPAGTYALEVFDHLALTNELQDKLVQAADVRQVMYYVASGNADLGIVYATDALVSQKVTVTAQIDPTYHNRILYTSALVTDSSHQEAAMIFQKYLRSEKAKHVFQVAGFSFVEEESEAL
ncbi:molybdate ABC transporter substrate-binding protein [Enterococcus sp. RIT-PI-f]|uniref:molybdate ABC transporter substrate-binding protein n=1 Tax=Enterococcus sp. RIT-PI-f TaxID=1690244 RepID=UPI0006B88EB0|nr:molybdate ABC transporter substrate-binding protein [Enterococcus sp. RIT-PI-f]